MNEVKPDKMDPDVVNAWVLAWFAAETGQPIEKLQETKQENYLENGQIDSLQFVNLITAIEKELGVIFVDEDLKDESIKTIDGVVEKIAGKQLKVLGSNKQEAKISSPALEQELYDALGQLGITTGDELFIHSDISAFLLMNSHVPGGDIRQVLVDTLRQAVGNSGTLIMPTFTYSFCRKQIFDHKQSPSTVGALTEYFRHLPGVLRTIDPIFSVAVQGPRSKEYMTQGKDSFGAGSIFGLLYERNVKLLLLGAPLLSVTMIHFAEQRAGVPYRYFKNFSGTVHLDGKSFEDERRYYVRDLDMSIVYDTSTLQENLYQNGALREKRAGTTNIMTIPSKDYVDMIEKNLRNNKRFLGSFKEKA